LYSVKSFYIILTLLNSTIKQPVHTDNYKLYLDVLIRVCNIVIIAIK